MDVLPPSDDPGERRETILPVDDEGALPTMSARPPNQDTCTKSLRASELRYRRLFESAKDGILILDAETGRIVDVNPFLTDLLGYSHAEFLGKKIWELGFFKHLAANADKFAELQANAYSRYDDLPLETADGRRIEVEFVSNVYLADGKKVIQCNIRDITERKRATAALRESEHLAQATVDALSAHIAVLDDMGIIIAVNRAWRDFAVANPPQPANVNEGANYLSVCDTAQGPDSGEAAAVAAGIRGIFCGIRSAFEMEYPCHSPDIQRWFVCRVSRFSWLGKVRVVVAHEDITARKRAEAEREQMLAEAKQARRALLSVLEDDKRMAAERNRLEVQLQQAQKMESVGRLAGGVAHDFNNLLMAIMGYAELCLDQTASGHPTRELLKEILSVCYRSAEITRQLLAFASKQTVAPKVLDLNETVAGMLKLLRRLIGEDINLAWMPGADLRPVRIDPSQVDQLLANLCVNARDAIAGVGKITLETGNITIDANYSAAHVEAVPGPYVFLAVSDDGSGMDKETLDQVFEPFFTTKGIGKGTGLGLATVYGIVKQNSGFLYAYSEPGKGTTFKIYLPQVAVEPEAVTSTGQMESLKGHGETILLVEDERSLRFTCGRFMETLGYQVMQAETPGEALKMSAERLGQIDLLLTDVVMPGMDGRQLAQRLCKARPGLKTLFMSGYTADVITQRGVLAEGVQFLSKPFSREILGRKLREVLESRERAAPAASSVDKQTAC